MPAGPTLIFDKSALESLSLDEVVLLDNFYMSNITPLFFVECLADLEKCMRGRTTPEQLVGSLAERTPDLQSTPNVHHMTILTGELSRQFDLRNAPGRVLRAGGEPVQLGDRKGVVFRRSPEAEAFERWTRREFLEIERNIAEEWRWMLTRIDFNAMVRSVMAELGHWRKPKTLEDAKLLGPVASQAPAPQMKRPNKSRLAHPDLLAALGVLLQLTKEVGGNYLASLQAYVTSVEQSERSAGRVVVHGPQTTRADGPPQRVADLSSGRSNAQHYVKAAVCTDYQPPSARNGAASIGGQP